MNENFEGYNFNPKDREEMDHLANKAKEVLWRSISAQKENDKSRGLESVQYIEGMMDSLVEDYPEITCRYFRQKMMEEKNKFPSYANFVEVNNISIVNYEKYKKDIDELMSDFNKKHKSSGEYSSDESLLIHLKGKPEWAGSAGSVAYERKGRNAK
jgi:hypothetical protein